MAAHKHAALMLQYAQDAAESETPWDRWEVCRNGAWYGFTDNPMWVLEYEYRRKPKTIRIGEFDVPEPARELLKQRENYWVACTGGIARFQWYDDDNDRKWLAGGLIHLTQEAAQQHAEARCHLRGKTMELREKIARAICGNWVIGDDRPWQQWLEEVDAVIEVLAMQEPVELRFPTMLRKMWSGREVQSWIDDQGPLYAAPGAQSAVPDGWIRAIDEEMVGAHIGVANAEDDYATAKEKINKLICWHVAVATDPVVNGGRQLVPIEPTSAMTAAFNTAAEALRQSHLLSGDYPTSWQPVEPRYRAMLESAPKPEGK